jgi:hypothetical protein
MVFGTFGLSSDALFIGFVVVGHIHMVLDSILVAKSGIVFVTHQRWFGFGFFNAHLAYFEFLQGLTVPKLC